MNEKYFLVDSRGFVYKRIEKADTDNLTKKLWIKHCRICNSVLGYYDNKSEVKTDINICESCRVFRNGDKKRYKSYSFGEVKFKLLIQKEKEIDGFTYPYMELKQQ